MQGFTTVLAMSLGSFLVGSENCVFSWATGRIFLSVVSFLVSRWVVFRIGFSCCCCGRVRLILGFLGRCSCLSGCVFGGDFFSSGDGLCLSALQRSLFLFLSSFPVLSHFLFLHRTKQKLIITSACYRDALFCSSVLLLPLLIIGHASWRHILRMVVRFSSSLLCLPLPWRDRCLFPPAIRPSPPLPVFLESLPPFFFFCVALSLLFPGPRSIFLLCLLRWQVPGSLIDDLFLVRPILCDVF